MLRNAILLLVARLAADCHASASLQISNEHGDCHLNTVSLDDGRNAFNTSCPIADVDALQTTVKALETSLEAQLNDQVDSLRAQAETTDVNLTVLLSTVSSQAAMLESYNATIAMLSSKLAVLEGEMVSMRGYTFGYDSCTFVGTKVAPHAPHSNMFEMAEIKLFDAGGTWITVSSATSPNYYCTVQVNSPCGNYDGGPHNAIDRNTGSGIFGPSMSNGEWSITMNFPATTVHSYQFYSGRDVWGSSYGSYYRSPWKWTMSCRPSGTTTYLLVDSRELTYGGAGHPGDSQYAAYSQFTLNGGG